MQNNWYIIFQIISPIANQHIKCKFNLSKSNACQVHILLYVQLQTQENRFCLPCIPKSYLGFRLKSWCQPTWNCFLDDRPYKRNPNCNHILSVGRSFPESTTWTRLVPSSHVFHLIVEQIWFETEIVLFFLDPAFFWLNIPPSVEPHPWHLGKPWSGRFELHYQWEGIAGFCIVSEYGRVRPKTTLCKGSKLPAVPALQAKDPLEQALPQRRP